MQFLINTLTHWEEAPRTRHHVALTLVRNHEVVFVTANKTGFFGTKKRTTPEGIRLFTPVFPVPHKIRYRIPVINTLYQGWLCKKLHREYSGHQVINFDFTATRIYDFFKNVIYYCNDSFSAISRNINPKLIADYHIKSEAEVAKRSSFCIGVSKILVENLLKYNPNSFVIELGSPDISDMDIIPGKLSKDERIQVGLMGFVRLYSISVDAVNYLLDNEKIDLTIIGPVEEKFLSLIRKRENLILKGPLTGRKLYEEMNKFDICIAPYSKRLTMDPESGVGTGSKIYHYFSLGKPVIITWMAGLQNVSFPKGFLYIATKDEEYPALVSRAMDENSDEKIAERANFARANAWSKRMEVFIEYVKQYSNLKN